MINLTVVSIKDLIKNLVKFIAIIVFVIICTRFFNLLKNINIKDYIGNKLNEIKGKTFYNAINDNVSFYKKENDNFIFNNFKFENVVDLILEKEISFLEYIKSGSNDINQENNKNKKSENKDIDAKIELASKGKSETLVLEKNNKKDVYNKTYKGVKIKNESKYKLTEKDLNPENIDFKNKKDIVIYHTHTCESYTQTDKYKYKETGLYKTTNLNYSVARVGTELTKYLEKYNFNVKHNITYHDYPKYNGSYSRSLKTVEKILKTSKASLVIDLHRDALGSNSSYAPTIKINGEEASQLMFVIGTDGGGLTHKNWKTNLKLAVKVQETANKMYPGLFKPIIVRNSRYNQHVSDGAYIIEVGATGNTLEQCLVSMKYLSSVIDEVMNN